MNYWKEDVKNKIDYSAFFQCPENKASYITAKYGIPHEELKQIFIYVVAHWNRIQLRLNQEKPWTITREDTTIKLVENLRSNPDLAEDIPVLLSFDDAMMACIIYDIMDF